MATKKALVKNVEIRVENWSSFDKSNYNATTGPLGAIIPLVKRLMIPGKFRLALTIGAQLPPLASDPFLRTHLKVECMSVPLRLCSGSFESWYSGVPILAWDSNNSVYVESRAQLPRLGIYTRLLGSDPNDAKSQVISNALYGPHSLMDYFGVKKPLDASGNIDMQYIVQPTSGQTGHTELYNILPFVAYGLCYDSWYRNKQIQKPLFGRAAAMSGFEQNIAHVPYTPFSSIHTYSFTNAVGNEVVNPDLRFQLRQNTMKLGDGKSLLELRQRNYGDDYFTSALSTAQEGNPVTIDTSAGYFSIQSFREGNSLQHFSEINKVAGPDMVQANKARYGVDLSMGVAQRPVLHGSADFPMFTSGVEQSAGSSAATFTTGNPFESVAARYGRAHAEGKDFVCEVEINEPSYLFVFVSLVPEANYSAGVEKDMRRFTKAGSLADLPCSALEGVGFEPIHQEEIDGVEQTAGNVFGYQPQYTYHKLGISGNEIHGLFRRGASLQAFMPQRPFSIGVTLSSNFLEVKPTDLDNVMAVSGQLSQYGVMIDAFIDLKVSEPLGESRLPSLVNPAEEHGRAVYVQKGGIHI